MRPNRLPSPTALRNQLVLTVLAIYLHTFSEWIFFATKPSFMLQSGAAGRLRVLLLAPLPPVLAGAALVLLWHLLSLLAGNPAWRGRIASAGIIIPALVLAGTALLLIDNFTYTIMGRGVITASGYVRWIYILLVLALAYKAADLLRKGRPFLARKPVFRGSASLCGALLAVSLLAAIFWRGEYSATGIGGEIGSMRIERTPNILLLGSDGMSASHMSLYGYSRGTTPVLEGLAEEGLLCENCFTNAGCSGSSIASMMTGRLPTRLRLIFPPDILRGVDAYRHLPGIMRRLGYRTFDISIRHYADPYDLNMRKAFDWANYREIDESFLSEICCSYLGMEADYFMRKMYARLSERLLHISGYRRMVDSYGEVAVESRKHKPEADGSGEVHVARTDIDDVRLEALYSFIDESDRPFLAHLHLLGTHGPYFHPKRRVFSRDREQHEEWMTDFYDDAVYNFDLMVGKVIMELEERGLRDNTLIVILTDHGRSWSIRDRLPLLFLFPEGEHAGRIAGNTQILDISPTILDYLGIDPPGWMEGGSLLAGGPEPGRHIFTSARRYGDVLDKTGGKWKMDAEKAGPPFYSLGTLGIIRRSTLFNLVLDDSRLEISSIEGHTLPAGAGEEPDPESIEQLLVDHLIECGYAVSSLNRPLEVELISRRTRSRRAAGRGKKPAPRRREPERTVPGKLR